MCWLLQLAPLGLSQRPGRSWCRLLWIAKSELFCDLNGHVLGYSRLPWQQGPGLSVEWAQVYLVTQSLLSSSLECDTNWVAPVNPSSVCSRDRLPWVVQSVLPCHSR